MTRVLDVSGLEGGYGSVQILYGIDMYVDEGEFVTVIGPNGCGKSTFIKTIFGIATYYRGGILYRGEEVSGWRTDQLVNHGIAYVPQVDNVFPSLSVLEHLSPLYLQQIIESIYSLRDAGITILIVEQNARLSLARSDRGYIISNGKVVHTGDAQHILTDPEIGEYFLGSTGE